MSIYSTEISSSTVASDKPIHERLLKAYYVAKNYAKGSVLEIGCGEGRGIQLIAPEAKSYTGIDKIESVVEKHKANYPDYTFLQAHIPPIQNLEDNSFDAIFTFQVIEHIKNDKLFLEEIHRLLKKGGIALITTPNIKYSLTRNPWHVREYTAEQLESLCQSIFKKTTIKGIKGNQKVMDYFNKNKASVRKFTRWDIFNLQYRLPAGLLKVPYEIANRMNRNNLKKNNDKLVDSIGQEDFSVSDDAEKCIDLLAVVEK